jgi:hypothetical protein
MRRLLIGAACVAALALPSSASASFTGVKTPEGGAVLEGDDASDTVVLKVVGGFVEHNLSGFASARDFDSSNPGEQTVSDAARTRVVVNGNGGTDVLRVEEDGGGDVFWAFSPTCMLRDPGRPQSGGLRYPGDGVNEVELCYGNGTESAEIAGGAGADSFFFLDTKQDVPVSVDGRGGDDWAGHAGNTPGGHSVRSVITFAGGDGFDEADMLDQSASAATYELTPEAIKRSGYPDMRLAPDVDYSWVYAGTGADQVTITDSTRAVQVWGGPGDDLIDASTTTSTARVVARGEDGNDRMLGGGGIDVFFAQAGNDELVGGGETDNLVGGDGDDTLRARDGMRDSQLDCDAGNDTVEGDELDRPSAKNCETTDFRDGTPPPTGGGTDTVAPALSSPKLSKKTFRVGRRGRTVARLTLRSSEAAKLTARFQLRVCKRRRCSYKTVRGTLTADLAAGANTVALDGYVAKKKLKPGRYKLQLDVKDAAGNKGKRRTLSLTVKR